MHVVGMGGEVAAQPLLLRGAGAAAADLGAVGVEGDQVPGADVEAVVALCHLAGGGPEVVEVRPAPAGGLPKQSCAGSVLVRYSWLPTEGWVMALIRPQEGE